MYSRILNLRLGSRAGNFSKSVQSAALRVALGAFRTSPTLSLCAETGKPPLYYLFLTLETNFLASTAQYPQHPVFSKAQNPQNSLLCRLQSDLNKHLKLNPLLPLFFSVPPWLISSLDLRLDLANILKISNSKFRHHIKNTIVTEFPAHFIRCTDRSRSKVGYAHFIQDDISSYRIRNTTCVFTVEHTAILSCLSHLTILFLKSSPLSFPV